LVHGIHQIINCITSGYLIVNKLITTHHTANRVDDHLKQKDLGLPFMMMQKKLQQDYHILQLLGV